MDHLSLELRKDNMRKIQGKNTKPEIALRKAIWHRGYRYVTNYAKLPGKPDIAFPGRKKVIFVNGCFWHKHDCKYFSYPKTNSEFWFKKINKNAERDKRNYADLQNMGWSYLIVWTCELKKNNFADTIKKAIDFIENSTHKG